MEKKLKPHPLNKISIIKLLIYSFLLLTAGCTGGGMGNIQIYVFDITKSDLNKYIDELYKDSIILKPRPTAHYTYQDDKYSEICMVIDKNDSLLFSYKLKNVESQPTRSMLILLSGSKYHEVLNLSGRIPNDLLDYYRELFGNRVVLPLERISKSKSELIR